MRQRHAKELEFLVVDPAAIQNNEDILPLPVLDGLGNQRPIEIGGVDELTQPWTGRTCDVFVWMFDLLGLAAACWILWFNRQRLAA